MTSLLKRMSAVKRLYAYLAHNQVTRKKKQCRIIPSHAPEETDFIDRLLWIIRPYDAHGINKVRIGGDRDGGYVMLDPGKDGIAYSLGVSNYSPWDLEMAERGFQVWQYDGSITAAPDTHPNLHFRSCFVGAASDPENNVLSFREIIAENNHRSEHDIILQMDIENAEWDILRQLDRDDLLRFKQIIIEFHDYYFDRDKLAVLEKINTTHTPIHVHYNNHIKELFYIQEKTFLYNPSALEISYARTADYSFTQSRDYYPGVLDRSNKKNGRDIPIGYFDLLVP